MLEYFSYQKLKKHQAEKAAREAEVAKDNEASTTTPSSTGTHIAESSQPSSIPLPQTPSPAVSPQPQQEHTHSIPRKPLPVLTKEDEDFLRGFVDEDDAPEKRPVLPNRPTVDVENMRVAGDSTGNAQQVVVHDGKEKEHGKRETYGEYVGEFVGGIRSKIVGKGKGKEHEPHPEAADEKDKENEVEGKNGKEKEKHEGGRFAFIGKTFSKKDKKLEPAPVVTPAEAEAEKEDITAVLDSLNLSAVNNRAFSISAESQALLEKFTVILKDLVNGVPTAFDDLTHLLDNSQETLEKGYESLPSFLQKLVAQLPAKLTGGLAPELLAAASASQGLNAAEASAGGFTAGVKSFLTPSSLKDLVTKPGAVVSLLKSIMNVLKLRWPAFMGTNVLFSLGLFILLFVFWYCHKRGREERIKREGAAVVVDSEGRIVELEDDPLLPAASEAGPSGTTATPVGATTTSADRTRSQSRTGRPAETPSALRPDAGLDSGEARSRSRPSSASSWRSGRSLRRKKEGEEVAEVRK